MEGSVRKGLGKAECVEVLDAGGSGVEPVKDCPFAPIAFMLQFLLEFDFDGSGLWLRHYFLLLHFEPSDPLHKNLRATETSPAPPLLQSPTHAGSSRTFFALSSDRDVNPQRRKDWDNLRCQNLPRRNASHNTAAHHRRTLRTDPVWGASHSGIRRTAGDPLHDHPSVGTVAVQEDSRLSGRPS